MIFLRSVAGRLFLLEDSKKIRDEAKKKKIEDEAKKKLKNAFSKISRIKDSAFEKEEKVNLNKFKMPED